MAASHLSDAELLLTHGRFQGAAYLCGYVLELTLKARICELLGWAAYRVGNGYQSFKTHDLDLLLDLTGQSARVKTAYLAEWSAVSNWSPELRYLPVGAIGEVEARDMIECTTTLWQVL